MQKRVRVFEAPALLVVVPPAGELGSYRLFVREHVWGDV
jgi:hypothetical protein